MATTQEAIARLRMIFETQGTQAAIAEMKKLETAETSLGQSSLNLDRAFGNLERRYSETARATFEFERAMKTLNSAVAQNPALAERAAAVQQTIAARYQATMQASKQAHEAQTAYGVGLNALSQQATVFAASTGVAGSMLQTLGKGGLVAAVGIGAAAIAYGKLDEGVSHVAQYARETLQFAEATGLTTSQVQGLNKEATKFGISSDELHTGLLRFTAGMEEVRNGGGPLLDIIRKIDPALAEQAVSAGNSAAALDIVGEALRRSTNEFDRAKLSRVAFRNANIGLMVKDLDLPSVTERYATKGISEDMLREIDKLEKEVTSKGTNIEKRLYASFAEPWLKAKLAVIEYLESFLKVQEAANQQTMATHIQELINLQKELQDGIKTLEEAAKGEGFLDRWFSSSNRANAEAYRKELEKVTAELDKLQGKKTGPETPSAPPDARGVVRFKMEAVEEGTYDRQLQVLKAIEAEYPNLVTQDAVRMKRLQEQLNIAQAMPGVARMEAQERARIAQLLGEGKTLETAQLIAAKERAIVQAQINTAAQQQLLNLQNQAGVAAAVTGADKIRAQEQATINSLLQQGVDLEIAQAIAAQERANAEAAVNANIERQVTSLNESTQLIRAQIQDMQEQAGTGQKILGIHEMMVRTQQAYNQALREGADAEHAGAIAAATWNNLVAQRTMQQTQASQQEGQQARTNQQQADAQANADALAAQQAGNARMRAAEEQFAADMGSTITQLAQAGSQAARTILTIVQYGDSGASWTAQGDLMAAIVSKAKQEVALLPQQQRGQQALDQLKQLQDEFRLGGAATPEAKAQIQAQLTYEKLIKEGVSASVAQQIANQELANTMQELAKSVDANTTALQSQLDPIYTEGRAALRIGYYGEGSGGTQRIVTGTGYANENTPAAPPASGSNLIVINNNFAAGAVMGDRRTQYQAANAYGRAIAATGK